MIEVCGLWVSATRKGDKYLGGNLGQKLRVMIFQNKNKRPDSKDPDYYLCVDERRPQDGAGTTGRTSDDAGR